MTAGSPGTDLHWLAMPGDFRSGLSQALAETEAEARWEALVALAGLRLDFLQTMKLDRALSRTVAFHDRPGEARIKVALVGSSTLEHLVPAIRIGALRRGLLVEPWLAPFGQWRQDILDPRSGLHRFAPNAVLLCLDSASLVPDIPLDASPDEVAGLVRQTVDDIASLWRSLKERLGATVIQQTILPIEVPAFGHFERQVPAAPGAVADRLDRELVDAATREGVLLLDLRRAASSFGVRALGDPMLWHHARQEIAPPAAPWVGDQVARILAATRGLSKKVLVLDLDNTLWGGVIGDDGIENIVLGQGSAAGEAFVAFQRYVKRLAQRGVILAVSSKNDLAVAASAFDDHPEMVLRRHDIAAFEASWGDKPAALRRIAKDLDVGLDS
ncbi:MAG: HAD-IIIC family phosphatase, partial [Microvirga sp.]